ncbi:MAG: RNA methyltransferase, partial [Symploca sp. SIO2G7]|nr:RNA methyltransferase [Symploca sp. SIO2G7]
LLNSQPSALIFGPEDRGLNNDEMLQAQRFIKISTCPIYASLNLAQAVAICCYELFRVRRREITPSATNHAAPLDELNGYYDHLESILLKIGYLYPHTASSRMGKFRQLGHRATLSSQDVAMLRGILRQIDWAVNQGNNSQIS